MDEKQNIPSSQANAPRIYVVENNGKNRFLQATTDMEDDFIVSTFPSAKLATQQQQDEEAAKRKERGLIAPDLSDLSLDEGLFKFDEKVSQNENKTLKQQSIDRLTGQDLQDKANNALKNDFAKRRANDPLKVIEDDVNRYARKQKHLDELKQTSDFPTDENFMPKSVVDEIVSESSELQPDSERVVVDNNSRIPTIANSFLLANQEEYTSEHYVPTSADGPFVKTVSRHTAISPKLKREVVDWLNNTEMGQRVIQQEAEVLANLNQSIEEFKQKVESTLSKEYNNKDAVQAKKYLNEIEKIQNAYADKDRNAFIAGVKELGRRAPYALANTATVGILDMISAEKLFTASADSKNILTQEGLSLMHDIQNAYSQDTTIAQSIAKGVTDTMPFMAEFATTGAIVGKAAKAGGKLALKGLTRAGVNTARIMGKSTQLYNSSVLMRAASNIVKEPLSAGAKAFIMPSTFRNAIEDSAENNYSNFLDAYSKNWFINTLSNLSENMGKYIPEPKFADKFGWTKKIADATGMQGVFGEFVEENIETVLQAGFETGEAEWSDLVDPRNQAVTLGVVVALQLPFASIRAGAKASSVYRDKKQQYQINKGYKTNSANIITVLGKDYGAEVMQDIDDLINSIQDENELNDKLNAMLNNMSESNRLTYEGINAVRSYTQASVAKNAVIQAKQEEALGRDTEVKDMLTELANPENGMLQEVEILTEEDTFTVIKGNLVAGQEEGSIDFDNSSKEVYVKNPRTGEVLVIPAEQVKSILSSVPLDEAILQAQTAISEPIEADIANQVHYDQGRAVVFNGMDNQTYSGEIIGFNPETGNYIIAETVSMQQMEIEPRFIYPSTHLDGLEAGTEVRYIAEDGTEQIGIMDQNITSRDMLEGTTFVDGMQIPLDNILGKYVAKESTPFNEVVEEDTTIENQEQSDLDSTIEMQDEVEVDDQAEEMKMTEQGQPDFYAVKPTTTLSYIADLLGNDSTLISNYIVAQIKETESKYKKLKEPTVSTDIFEYQKSIERFNAQKENTQSNLKYWNDVAVEFAKIGNADKAIVDIATSSVKDNLMKKIMSNTDLTNITDEKATELIDDISSIRKHAVSGAIKLDQSELNNLNKIDQVLKAQGYEVPNLTDVEADDVISDINNQTIADGVQDADPNTVLNYFTNPIQLPIIKNGQVIRKGLYDAEQRIANELVEIQKQKEEQARQEAEELETLTSEREKAFKVKAPVQLLENATEEDLQDIAESSTNPLEIFQAYYTALSYADDANLQQWERDLLGRKINPQSFLRFGDKNNVSGTIAKSWFVRRNKQGGYNNSTNLDIIAQELTETSGVEVTPQMIVDFILDNPSNYIKKQTQLTTDLNNRFRQVVQGMYGLKNINGIESNSAQNFINNFIVIMDNADLHSSETVNSLDPIKLSDTVASVLREIQFTELSSIEEAYQALDEVKESKFAGFPFTESDYNETINFLNNAEKINQEAVQRRGEELNESQTIRDVEPISQESQQPTQEEVIAYQESQVDQNPTEAQKEAGNYKKGHINIQGLDITIENPPGSVRSGTDVNGKAWSIEMKNPYGYIKRTMGADGDHVDVVYGKKLDSDDVYIFNQIKDDGSFDEHKVVIAASSEKSAKAMIQANYNKGAFKFDGMHKLTMSEFKKWLDNPQNTNKPFVPNTNPILVESVVELPQTETKPTETETKQGKSETKQGKSETKDSSFGSDNKFITNEKADELRERIRKRMGQALMSGFDPELVRDCVMLAAYYVEAGARSFKDYSNNMLKDLGVGIAPMLKSVYSWAKLDESIPAEIRKQMDSLDSIAENVIKEQEHLIDQPFTKYDEIAELQEQEKQLDEQIKKEVEEIAKRDKADAEELGTLDIELEIVEEEQKEEKSKKNNDYHITNSEVKKERIDRFKTLIKALKSNGLALSIEVVDELPNDLKNSLKDSKGSIYGWVDYNTDTVFLVSSTMNLNTPIHEFGHLWVRLLRNNYPEAYKYAQEMILNSEYFDRVSNEEFYSNLPLERLIEEALATAIGDYGAENFRISKYSNIKDILSRFFDSFKKLIGLGNQYNFKNMSLDKMLNYALKDLTARGNISPNKYITKETIIEEYHPEMSNSFHRDMLDKKLNRYIFKFNKSKFIENYQDRYAPVKDFLDYLRKNGTPVAEYNDWYLKATHLFGQVDHAIEMYDKNLNQPMLKSVNALIKAKDIEYRDIENYVLIKHAVERNEYFKSKDEELGKKIRADYSGLIPMLEEVEYENAEAYIENFESGNEALIAELWTNINKSTNNSLKLLYDNGVLSKEIYEELKTRYKYYVPLRGHDEVTAEDRWADVYDSQGSRFNNALKVAKGRRSRATSPFANIYNINQSAISEAYKNKLNQSLLRLAKSDKTGLLKASSVWYERVGQQEDGTPIYEIRTPEYSENEDIRLKNEEEFEAKMLELEANQMAINSRTKRVDIGDMFIKPSQAKEHEVLVRQNGKMNVIYVNANPRVAKAINGTNVVDKGQALSTLSNVTRFMASLFTTKNPKFILTNASRDFIMASSMLIVKEGPKYQAKFFKNITNAMGALRRYNFGKPTADNKYDVYLNEFLMNGAKTGYSHFIELKRLQKNIEKDLKNNTVDGNKKLMRRIGDVLGAANDMAENYTRLSTYITSRQSGRSISRSVSDAKEVTLNFNRRGAGGGGILSSNVLTSAFVFFNVGLQAIDNFTKVAKANPKATAGLIAGFTSVGFLAPLVNSLLIGGGDDEDYDPMDVYFNIGQWERQNNFTVWTGNGFIKIPIAQELRVFYAMGDNLFLMASGRKDILDGVLDQFESFSDLIPNNPMGAITASWAELVPEPLKPIAQIAANTKFTGSPIFNDKYNNEAFSQWSQARTTKNGDTYAPAFIVGLTKALDYMSGGDGVQKGAIDINPDKLDHLLGGYLGGVYRMFAQGVDAAYKTAHNITSNEEDILHTRIKDLPINSFYTSKDELRYISDHEAEQYYDIRSKTEQGLALIKKYAQNAVLSDGGITDEELESQLEALNITRDVLPLLYSRVKAIQKISKSMAYFEKDSKDKAEREIAKIQKQTIEIFNNLNNIKEDENLATEYEDIEIDEFKVKE